MKQFCIIVAMFAAFGAFVVFKDGEKFWGWTLVVVTIAAIIGAYIADRQKVRY